MSGIDERPSDSPASQVKSLATSSTPVTVSIGSTPTPLRAYRITPTGLVEISQQNAMGAFLDKPKTCKTNTTGEGKVFIARL